MLLERKSSQKFRFLRATQRTLLIDKDALGCTVAIALRAAVRFAVAIALDVALTVSEAGCASFAQDAEFFSAHDDPPFLPLVSHVPLA